MKTLNGFLVVIMGTKDNVQTDTFKFQGSIRGEIVWCDFPKPAHFRHKCRPVKISRHLVDSVFNHWAAHKFLKEEFLVYVKKKK